MLYEKAYAGELVAIKHLTSELTSQLDLTDAISEDVEKTREGGGEYNETSSQSPIIEDGDDIKDEEVVRLKTDNLRNEIKAMENVILNLLKLNLNERKNKIYSAIIEDGIISLDSSNIGPWLQFQHLLRYHIDIEIKDTFKNVLIFFFIARFGAYGVAVSVNEDQDFIFRKILSLSVSLASFL